MHGSLCVAQRGLITDQFDGEQVAMDSLHKAAGLDDVSTDSCLYSDCPAAACE